MNRFLFIPLFILFCLSGCSDCQVNSELKTGAERTSAFLDKIKTKKTAIVANQSSLISGVHLVDSLMNLNVPIMKIFSPEHGFRGMSEAGEKVEGGIDDATGLKVISLYGASRKPKSTDLEDVEIIVFDLQDVGTRFYTYISSLHYIMEACAENQLDLIILDRPNPNGEIIDGPVLEEDFKSFVGMHPVPVLHGMTIGEYAMMINGEEWLGDGKKCRLVVIPCSNYSRSQHYELPVPPSPNLPDYQSVRLYPSLCFFEGTQVSVGRGTDFPFKVFGHPGFDKNLFSFTPESRPGYSLHPKHENRICYGQDLSQFPADPGEISGIHLEWLISAYRKFPDGEKFFNHFFTRLAGTEKLQIQIENGLSEDEIRTSWQPELEKFKQIRKKYLLYPDI